MADYAHFWDAHDAEGWAHLFTPDGVFEIYVPEVDLKVRRLTNVGERVSAAAQAFGGTSGAFRTRMFQANVRFDELSADVATTRCNVFLIVQRPERETPELVYSGTCQDEFRRTPVGWRFSRRCIESDQNPGYGR